VMRPVTRRAGVTSKAGFAAGEASGEIRTWAMSPAAVLPQTSETSSAERSSIGISFRPS
jgi:hypothetical protein